MPTATALLAIDQGTTSTRAMVFDRGGDILGQAQRELRQIFPQDGWVEHDPEEIWRATVETCRGALADSGLDASTAAGTVAAIGITNQRETTLVWHREDGRPIHNAIVWQDRRTAEMCARLVAEGHEPAIQAKTGLVVDPYFSASKIAWLLENVSGARQAAARGELAFGTVDTFLLWRLTGGRVHATDASNAARTMLFDIHRQDWDDELLALFGVPHTMLPEVRDSSGEFGVVEATHFGLAAPVTGIAGDQQAALVGQACFAPGMVKCTFGTGAFALLNTGTEAVASRNRLLTTVAYRLGGKTVFALEGSVFSAGAAVQWLRDGLGLIDEAAEIEALAASVPDAGGVHVVPAFTGLGAPHWDAAARGAILGLTRDSGPAHIARATLDAVCHQTRDLIEAMAADGPRPATMRVDGGMAVNDGLMQRLADILGLAVERPRLVETTAWGAACLAGLGAGIYGSLDEIAARWSRDAVFAPAIDEAERKRLDESWQNAVRRVLGTEN